MRCGQKMKRDANKSLGDNKRLNILILYAPWNNRGDEAAIRAMIDSLRAELPVSKMSVVMTCENVPQFPYDDIEIMKSPLLAIGKPVQAGYSLVISILDYLHTLSMLFTFGKLSFTRAGREFIKAVDEADVVIHAPGGPDMGDLYGHKLLGDTFSLRELIISKVFKNKPFFFYAPSMGPFSRGFLNFARRPLLKRADAIIVREEISAKYLKEQLGLDSYVTMDSAFQSDIPEDYVSQYTTLSEILNIIENERVIGITMTDLKWHPAYRKCIGDKIKNSFVPLIQYLITQGYAILLIPILFGERLEEQDVSLLEDTYSSIQKEKQERIFLLPSDI
ncbi:hypothetical protein FJZ33_03485, partial [Candidatus Poribacteria bacterium]|nr:hypothetical protein [Candidatus Poribacteria bacterium]